MTKKILNYFGNAVEFNSVEVRYLNMKYAAQDGIKAHAFKTYKES